jgi:hypothetical protein
MIPPNILDKLFCSGALVAHSEMVSTPGPALRRRVGKWPRCTAAWTSRGCISC